MEHTRTLEFHGLETKGSPYCAFVPGRNLAHSFVGSSRDKINNVFTRDVVPLSVYRIADSLRKSAENLSHNPHQALKDSVHWIQHLSTVDARLKTKELAVGRNLTDVEMREVLRGCSAERLLHVALGDAVHAVRDVHPMASLANRHNGLRFPHTSENELSAYTAFFPSEFNVAILEQKQRRPPFQVAELDAAITDSSGDTTECGYSSIILFDVTTAFVQLGAKETRSHVPLKRLHEHMQNHNVEAHFVNVLMTDTGNYENRDTIDDISSANSIVLPLADAVDFLTEKTKEFRS